MINKYASKQKQNYCGINNQEKKLSKKILLREKVLEKAYHVAENKRENTRNW